MGARFEARHAAGAAQSTRARTALVAGGAGGIGSAVARRLGRGGDVVHAVDLLAISIDGIAGHRADLADEAACRSLVQAIAPVDVLVHAAAIHPGFAPSGAVPDGLF